MKINSIKILILFVPTFFNTSVFGKNTFPKMSVYTQVQRLKWSPILKLKEKQLEAV